MFLCWDVMNSREELNALLPMVLRRAEGTDGYIEEEGLREREGVGTQIG